MTAVGEMACDRCEARSWTRLWSVASEQVWFVCDRCYVDLAGSPNSSRASGEAGARSFPTSTEVTVTRTTFNPKDIIEQFSDITPELAQAGVQSLPVTMVYEARQALTQLVDEGVDSHVVEPLARAVGWAEALAFAFNTTGSYNSLPSRMTAGNGARTIQ